MAMPEHGERKRERAGSVQLARNLARHRVDGENGARISAPIVWRTRLPAWLAADSSPGGSGRRMDRVFGLPTPGSARHRVQRIDPGPDILDFRRLLESGPDLLSADEIHAEIKAARRDQSDRGKHQQQRDQAAILRQRMKSMLVLSGDELQQAHRLILRCAVRAGAPCGAQSATIMRVTFTA
jgi:hypothetical protein